MNLKKILQSIMKLVTPENMCKLMDSFNKGVQEFGDSMGKLDKEFSNDVKKSNNNKKSESRKNQKNIDKIFGSKKQKIWSDKKSKESLF